jgi:hypothetical protein
MMSRNSTAVFVIGMIVCSELALMVQSFSLPTIKFLGLSKKVANNACENSGSVLRMQSALSEPTRPSQLVVGSPLPRVYVYDHCPFCVRVRFVLGIKNIKHNVIYLANDDVETPTKLVGTLLTFAQIASSLRLKCKYRNKQYDLNSIISQ